MSENVSSLPRSLAVGVVSAAAIGLFFDAYAVNVYTLTLPLMAKDLKQPVAALGIILTIFLVGYTLGTIGFGPLCDRFGRRITLGISILGYGLATSATGLAGGIASLGIFRFLTGVGGGGELTVGSPYTAEVLPARKRGLGMGVMIASYPLGIIITGFAVKLALAQGWGWRVCYGFAVVPAILILLARLKIEESPRYLEVVRLAQERRKKQIGLGAALKEHPYLRRYLAGGVLMLTSSYYHFYAASFSPLFVVHTLHMTMSQMITWVQVGAVAWLFASIGAGALSDWVGVRRLGIFGSLIMGATVYYMFSGSVTAFILGTVVSAAVGGGLWTIVISHINTMFPTEIRGAGFGWSSGLARVVSIAAPVITVSVAAIGGLGWSIQMSGLIYLCMFFGFLLTPETRGIVLNDVVGDSTPLGVEVGPLTQKGV